MPAAVTIGSAALMVLAGPIHQFEGFNRYADQTALIGIPHSGDVLSNIGFAIAGLFRIISLLRVRTRGHTIWHLLGLWRPLLSSRGYELAVDWRFEERSAF